MIERNKLYNSDCFLIMEDFPNTSVNIYYTDTPYNLGSEYIIDSQGHYVFTKASDFMNSWEAMDGRWWNKYFNEIYRTLKYGGYFITHNIDRQSDMWSYYARRNGLVPTQKLYWLFVDHFPKGVDVTKQLDRLQGQERIVVGKQKGAQKKSTGKYGDWGQNANADGTFNLTIPTSKIARKYEGYIYGLASLKQMVEEILVFYKPPKDTVPKDILAMEEIRKFTNEELMLAHPSVLNLKKTSIPSSDGLRWTPQLLVAEEIMPRLLENPYINHPEAAKLKSSVKVIEDSTPKNDTGNISPYYLEPKVQGNKKHVSPKPLPLVRWIIDLFKPPEQILIVDTFMGTGAIPYVCKEQGIDYVGIELDKDTFDDAKEYIEGLDSNLTLFGRNT